MDPVQSCRLSISPAMDEQEVEEGGHTVVSALRVHEHLVVRNERRLGRLLLEELAIPHLHMRWSSHLQGVPLPTSPLLILLFVAQLLCLASQAKLPPSPMNVQPRRSHVKRRPVRSSVPCLGVVAIFLQLRHGDVEPSLTEVDGRDRPSPCPQRLAAQGSLPPGCEAQIEDVVVSLKV